MLKTLDWRNIFNPKLESIVEGPTLKSFFDMDPLMTAGYIIVGGVSILTIVMANIEKRMIKKGDEDGAALINIITKSVLVGGSVTGAIYYIIFKNPLWKWIL